MNFTNKEYEDAQRKQIAVGKFSIKHPGLAAAFIFYVIGFLIGYGMGKI